MTKALTKDEKAAKRRPGKFLVRAGSSDATKVDEVPPLGLKRIEDKLANGHDHRDVARCLGTSRKALRRLREDIPEVEEAHDRGLGRLATEVAGLLLKHAREGNVTAAIFLAKAKLGWRDHGLEPGGDDQPAVQVNITIPPAMSRDEFQKIIEHQEPAKQ
ncbi:MAG: hypothetical protein V3W06_02400 [Acidimicrobiia bacterium]